MVVKKSKAVKPSEVFCTKSTPRQDSRSAGESPPAAAFSNWQQEYFSCLQVIDTAIENPYVLLYSKKLEGGYLCWVLSPQQIYEHVWKEDPVDCDHIVRNTICQLRRKLARPELIQTVVGYGYKFVVESGTDQ